MQEKNFKNHPVAQRIFTAIILVLPIYIVAGLIGMFLGGGIAVIIAIALAAAATFFEIYLFYLAFTQARCEECRADLTKKIKENSYNCEACQITWHASSKK